MPVVLKLSQPCNRIRSCIYKESRQQSMFGDSSVVIFAEDGLPDLVRAEYILRECLIVDVYALANTQCAIL